jgi:hypothetical protein
MKYFPEQLCLFAYSPSSKETAQSFWMWHCLHQYVTIVTINGDVYIICTVCVCVSIPPSATCMCYIHLVSFHYIPMICFITVTAKPCYNMKGSVILYPCLYHELHSQIALFSLSLVLCSPIFAAFGETTWDSWLKQIDLTDYSPTHSIYELWLGLSL